LFVVVIWDIDSDNWRCGFVVTPTYSFVCCCLRIYLTPPEGHKLARTLFFREGFQLHILWLENGYSKDGCEIRNFVKENKHFGY
jgi:hypothetical protein